MNRKSKKLLAWCLVVTLVITQMLFTNMAFAASSRAAGSNRYQTAIEISKAFTSAENAILAYGEDFPDALAAAPLAKKLNAPIFLTDKDKLADGVLARMQTLGVKNVYVIGGTGVVPQAVVDSLTGMTVKRLAGSDRYATALAVANEVGATDTVVVAYGENYPDALSISSIAAAKGWPILLTDKNSMDAATKAYIGSKKAYVVGGEGVISAAVFNGLAAGSVRLSGSDRYATNVAVMNQFVADIDWNNVYLAYGENFPDALAGSAVAAQDGAAVVLVGATMPAATEAFVDSKVKADTNVIALGGSSVVSDAAVAAVGAGTVTPPPTTGVVSVSAATQPTGSSIVGGTILNPVFNFTVTAGSADFNMTSVIARQYGTAASFNASVISSVYLMDGLNVLTTGTMRDGEARLNKSIVVPAGTSKTFTVAIDMASAATTTVQFGLDSAASIVGNATVGGSFPIKGNVYTNIAATVGKAVLTAPDAAGIIDDVTVNKTQETIGAFQVQATQEESVSVKRVRLKVSDVKASDFQNYYLYKDNGITKIDTLGVVDGDYVVFDLSSNPVSIAANSSVKFRVKADPISGAGKNVNIVVEYGYDVLAIGNTSGVRVKVVNVIGAPDTEVSSLDVNGAAGTIEVSAGDPTLTVATDSPKATDKLIMKTTDAGIVRKYVLTAPGEDITIKNVPVVVNVQAGLTLDKAWLYNGDTDTIIAGPISVNGIDGSEVTFTNVNWYVPSGTKLNLVVKATYSAGADGVRGADLRIKNLYYYNEISKDYDTIAGEVPGGAQYKAVASSGTITVQEPGTTLKSYSLAPNITGTEIGKFRIKGGNEKIDIKSIKISATANVAAAANTFVANATLWDADTNTMVAGPVQPDAAGQLIQFKDIQGVTLDTGDANRKTYIVKADILDSTVIDKTTGTIDVRVEEVKGNGQMSVEVITAAPAGGFQTTDGDVAFTYRPTTLVLTSNAFDVTNPKSSVTKLNEFKLENVGSVDAYIYKFAFKDNFGLGMAKDTVAPAYNDTAKWTIRDKSDDSIVDDENSVKVDYSVTTGDGTTVTAQVTTGSQLRLATVSTADAKGVKIGNQKSATFYLNGDLLSDNAYPQGRVMRIDLDRAGWAVYGPTENIGDGATGLIQPKFVSTSGPQFTIPVVR